MYVPVAEQWNVEFVGHRCYSLWWDWWKFQSTALKKYACLDEVCVLVFQGFISYSFGNSGVSLAAGCYPTLV